MLPIVKRILFLLSICIPAVALAAFDVDPLLKATLEAPVLDVAAQPDEEIVFVLTKGEVLIYSTAAGEVLDRIVVDDTFNGMTYQNDNRLVLTATRPPKLSVLQINRIYEIDITHREIKGSLDAKSTIVVFDDYQ